MPIPEIPRLLVPVDVSREDPQGERLTRALPGVEVVALGYFPVPDQSLPAQIKLNRGDEAAARLEEIAGQIAADGTSVETELVFTHDRRDPIDRIAAESDCDAVLIPGAEPTETIDRILVPLRGGRNVARIVAFAGAVARDSNASVTLFHAITGQDGDGHALLDDAADRLVADGLDEARITRQVIEGGDGYAEIIERGEAFDLIVLGETEPSLRERIFGSTPTKIADRTDRSVAVVRDIDSGSTANTP